MRWTLILIDAKKKDRFAIEGLQKVLDTLNKKRRKFRRIRREFNFCKSHEEALRLWGKFVELTVYLRIEIDLFKATDVVVYAGGEEKKNSKKL